MRLRNRGAFLFIIAIAFKSFGDCHPGTCQYDRPEIRFGLLVKFLCFAYSLCKAARAKLVIIIVPAKCEIRTIGESARVNSCLALRALASVSSEKIFFENDRFNHLFAVRAYTLRFLLKSCRNIHYLSSIHKIALSLQPNIMGRTIF